MNNTTARLSAITAAVLIAAAAGILWFTSHPGPGKTEVKAEFQDAFPLLAGMDVRESGAVAGSVRSIELTDHGTALVTLELNEGTEPPHSDASVAIRQQDITGDSYVALEPGTAPVDLGDDEIPVSRSIVAPRFDDLLNSLGDKERAATRLLLVETGKALDNRGAGLNEAILQLRPGLEAADSALAEVGRQNDALRSLVGNAEAVTAQAAPRSRELGTLIDSLSETLGETAARGDALDRALDVAPQTAGQATATLTELRRTTDAGVPLARALGDRAPELSQSVRRLGPFLEGARSSLTSLTPTATEAAATLRDAAPTLQASPRRVLTAPFDLTESFDGLLRAFLGNEDVLKTLAGADSYGQPPGNAEDSGLSSIAVESGDQMGYPGNDPDRNFLRAMVVPSCELFGVPVAPACLSQAILAGTTNKSAGGAKSAGASALPSLDQLLATPSTPTPGTDAGGSPAQTDPSLPSGPAAQPGTPPSAGPGKQGALDLLDFLLGGGK